MRKLLGRLLVEDSGQGLVEYTLIVLLVALVFWVAIKNTNIGSGLAAGWSKVTDCVSIRQAVILPPSRSGTAAISGSGAQLIKPAGVCSRARF